MKPRPHREPLLFINPSSPASDEPVIDALTRKMVAAYRAAGRDDILYCGFHWCVCGTASKNYDSILTSGMRTNSLCVHYLAHHREEVPQAELEKVAQLDCGEAEPTYDEFWGMRPVLREGALAECRQSPPISEADERGGKKAWWRFWR